MATIRSDTSRHDAVMLDLGIGTGIMNRFGVSQCDANDAHTLLMIGFQNGQVHAISESQCIAVKPRFVDCDDELVGLATSVVNKSLIVVVLAAPRVQGSATATISVWSVCLDGNDSQKKSSFAMASQNHPIGLFRGGFGKAEFVASAFADGTLPSQSVYRVVNGNEIDDITTSATGFLTVLVKTRSPLSALVVEELRCFAGFLDGVVMEINSNGVPTWRSQICGPTADLVRFRDCVAVADGISQVTIIGPIGVPNPNVCTVQEQAHPSFGLRKGDAVNSPSAAGGLGLDPKLSVSESSHKSIPAPNSFELGPKSSQSSQSAVFHNMPEAELRLASISHGPTCLHVCDTDGDGVEKLLVGTVNGKCAVVDATPGLADSRYEVRHVFSLASHPLSMASFASPDHQTVAFFGPWMSNALKITRSTATYAFALTS